MVFPLCFGPKKERYLAPGMSSLCHGPMVIILSGEIQGARSYKGWLEYITPFNYINYRCIIYIIISIYLNISAINRSSTSSFRNFAVSFGVSALLNSPRRRST